MLVVIKKLFIDAWRSVPTVATVDRTAAVNDPIARYSSRITILMMYSV